MPKSTKRQKVANKLAPKPAKPRSPEAVHRSKLGRLADKHFFNSKQSV